MPHHMGVVPARSHIFFGYFPETAKTASRAGAGRVCDQATKGLWPGPPSFTKVGEINLTNVGRL
jgi:hypothetical protein